MHEDSGRMDTEVRFRFFFFLSFSLYLLYLFFSTLFVEISPLLFFRLLLYSSSSSPPSDAGSFLCLILCFTDFSTFILLVSSWCDFHLCACLCLQSEDDPLYHLPESPYPVSVALQFLHAAFGLVRLALFSWLFTSSLLFLAFILDAFLFYPCVCFLLVDKCCILLAEYARVFLFIRKSCCLGNCRGMEGYIASYFLSLSLSLSLPGLSYFFDFVECLILSIWPMLLMFLSLSFYHFDVSMMTPVPRIGNFSILISMVYNSFLFFCVAPIVRDFDFVSVVFFSFFFCFCPSYDHLNRSNISWNSSTFLDLSTFSCRKNHLFMWCVFFPPPISMNGGSFFDSFVFLRSTVT